MDSVYWTDFSVTRAGIKDAIDRLEDGLGEFLAGRSWIEVQEALLLIEICKGLPDDEHTFPHGKYATIQHIESVVKREIQKLFQPKKR